MNFVCGYILKLHNSVKYEENFIWKQEDVGKYVFEKISGVCKLDIGIQYINLSKAHFWVPQNFNKT